MFGLTYVFSRNYFLQVQFFFLKKSEFLSILEKSTGLRWRWRWRWLWPSRWVLKSQNEMIRCQHNMIQKLGKISSVKVFRVDLYFELIFFTGHPKSIDKKHILPFQDIGGWSCGAETIPTSKYSGWRSIKAKNRRFGTFWGHTIFFSEKNRVFQIICHLIISFH